MSNPDALSARIGSNLRRLRAESGLSQKGLAEASQLSPTLISRIENALVRPSIATLEQIAHSLKVDIGYFFRDEENRQFFISYRGNRKNVLSQRGYEIEALVEEMESHFMDPVIVYLKRKDEQDKVELATHDGQEFMYVLEGKVELILGSQRFILKPGDAGYWIGSIPHKGISLSKKLAKTLNIHLIPGKRTGTFALKEPK